MKIICIGNEITENIKKELGNEIPENLKIMKTRYCCIEKGRIFTYSKFSGWCALWIRSGSQNFKGGKYIKRKCQTLWRNCAWNRFYIEIYSLNSKEKVFPLNWHKFYRGSAVGFWIFSQREFWFSNLKFQLQK